MLKRYWKFIKNMSLRGWMLIGTMLLTTFISGALAFKFYDKSFRRGYWIGWDAGVETYKNELKYPPREITGFRLIDPLPPKRLRNLINYQSADTTVYNEIK